ncbi:MAG: hypothetical protein J0H54_02325, partial [Rhizobiales bacterium]|nr:hypothetical protein [Hyphomicrobiales bacterium]
MSGLSGVERSGAGPSMVAPATDSAPAILDHSISAEIVAAAAAIEGEWRALADRAKVPVYQRYDWVDAFLRTVAAAQGIAPAILRIRVGGRTAAILPLGIERRGPLRIARMLGGGHANIRMPIVDPDAANALADPAQLAEVVIAALRHAGRRVDLLDLDALPLSWNGCTVPLATHPAARPARLPVGH